MQGRQRLASLPTLLVVALALAVGCARGGSEDAQIPAETGTPDPTTTADHAAELVGLWSNYFTFVQADEAEWVTAVPLVLRNVSDEPITIESITFDNVIDMEIETSRVAGPQSPGNANVMYRGWPTPTMPYPGMPQWTDGDLSDVGGYTIPTGPERSTKQLGGPNNGIVDAPNDASPLFKVRRADGASKGSASGVTVHYLIDGHERTASFPDASVLVCNETLFAESTCVPDDD